MSSLNELPQKGTYTLIVFVLDKTKVNVGKLGVKTFLQGYYTYTGSAFGTGASSLPCRVSRHLNREKKKRWHIDFLLADKSVTVESIVAIVGKRKLECQVNQLINKQMQARILVPRFGASDCLNHCGSHLLYIGNMDAKSKIYKLFQQKFGRKSIFIDLSMSSLLKA